MSYSPHKAMDLDRTPPKGIKKGKGGHVTEAQQARLYNCQAIPSNRSPQQPREVVLEGSDRRAVGVVRDKLRAARVLDGIQMEENCHRYCG